MRNKTNLKSILLTGACALFVTGAFAQDFKISGGDLKGALDAYAKQSGVAVMYSADAVKGVHTNGASGHLSPDSALSKILSGTGFAVPGRIGRDGYHSKSFLDEQNFVEIPPIAGQRKPRRSRAQSRTVTVTSSKLGGRRCAIDTDRNHRA